MKDRDEAIGLSIRERLEQHGVDDAEDRRVGTDAETERQDDDGREAWALEEPADGVSEIAHGKGARA